MNIVRARSGSSADLRTAGGAVALAALAVLVFGALTGLLVAAGGDFSNAATVFDPYLLRVALFTLWQAVLSTLLSVAPAILVARALAGSRSFLGRIVLALFSLPLALPAIVAALGILALYGRAGFLADALSATGSGQWPGVYGISGILIAHVFFNLPLATRLLVEALRTIPSDQWRLASQLGMTPTARFRFLEWPAIRRALPGAASLVFMLCVTSFTLVLTLGGGPGATTLEVAIYQALRFDFDPARATALTIVQVALTVIAMLLLKQAGASIVHDANLSVASRRFDRRALVEKAADGVVIFFAAAFVAAPMLAIVGAGIGADYGRLFTERSVQQAILTSLVVATLSGALAVCLAFMLVAASARPKSDALPASLIGGATSLILVAPPIVLASGWFILLNRLNLAFSAAPLMVVCVNAAMAIPFAARILRPAYEGAAARHDRLCAQLGIVGWTRLRLIDWSSLREPFLTAGAFSAALSLGDLGVIALFGSDSVQTLPYLLLLRMGSYRTQDAAGLALILAALCLVLILIADIAGREKSRAA